MTTTVERRVRIDARGVVLDGDLTVPTDAQGVVAFAHGSGSSRHSPRNRMVAGVLQERGFATLLLDLLTIDEERVDSRTRHLRFDVDLLADRLRAATSWLTSDAGTPRLPVGYFGASTGAAAALIAAAGRPTVRAVVSRGGRPDLAREHLRNVAAPTLLIVGSRDQTVLELNELAAARLGGPRRTEVIAGAGHLFEEPGALEHVAALAGDWFTAHLATVAQGQSDP
jgi:putative phosphoribosyl transferase